MSLTPGYFLAKTADLLAPAIRRGSATDDAGVLYATNLEHADQRAALIGAVQAGAAYTQTIVALTANMISGIDPIIAANAARRVLQFGGAGRDFAVSLVAAQAKGMPIYASARDDLLGKLCPIGALYLATGSGFAVNDTLVIWEA